MIRVPILLSTAHDFISAMTLWEKLIEDDWCGYHVPRLRHQGSLTGIFCSHRKSCGTCHFGVLQWAEMRSPHDRRDCWFGQQTVEQFRWPKIQKWKQVPVAQYLRWSDAGKFAETFLAMTPPNSSPATVGAGRPIFAAPGKLHMQLCNQASANCWYVRLCHVSLSLAPIGLRTASVWLFVQGASMRPSSIHPSRHKVAGLADQLTQWAEEAHVNKLPLVGSGHLKLTLANTGDMFRPCYKHVSANESQKKDTWATWDSRCPPQTSRSSSLQLDQSHPQRHVRSDSPPSQRIASFQLLHYQWKCSALSPRENNGKHTQKHMYLHVVCNCNSIIGLYERPLQVRWSYSTKTWLLDQLQITSITLFRYTDPSLQDILWIPQPVLQAPM